MKDLFKDSFRGKRVLITGHTGFKGSWLSIWLNELGAEVIGYALDPYSQKENFILSDLSSRIIDIRGDIRDKDKLHKVFQQYKPEIVFHLAAQPLVWYSYEQPQHTFEVNIMGTINILEMIKCTEETKVGVVITSDKCYENREWIWGYRENDRLGGYDPYSASKACSELVVSSYRNSFFNVKQFDKHGKSIATARAGNVIGGGDWSAKRIVPDCIRALEAGVDINIRNPKSIRPWQHVLEPLNGYLTLASKMMMDGVSYNKPWNFGPNIESTITVEEVVKRIVKYWGSGNWVQSDEKDNIKYETGLLNLDIRQAKDQLHWFPRWNVDEAIEKVVEWYKNYGTKDRNVYELCVAQIEDYCK